MDQAGNQVTWSNFRCSAGCWLEQFQCGSARTWTYCRSWGDFSGTVSGSRLTGTQIETFEAMSGDARYTVRAEVRYDVERNSKPDCPDGRRTNVFIPVLLLAGILGSVGVVVVDETGQELPGAVVEVLQQGQIDRRVITSQEGTVHFTALEPGTYFIRASLDGFRAQEVQALVSPLEPAEVRLVLAVDSMLDYWLSMGVIPPLTGTLCPSPPVQSVPQRSAALPAP